MAEQRSERSLGDLFAELSRETGLLVRKELQLAQVEMGQKVSRVSRHAAIVGIGGVLAHAGALALVAALVLMLVLAGLPAWAAALAVGIALLAIGGLLVRSGLAAIRREDLAPSETIQTLREGAAWAKHQAR